jgi:N-acetylmuramoyl-L-alanine amidase
MPSRAGWITGLSGALAVAALAWGLSRAPQRRLSPARAPADDAGDPARWPGELAALTRLAATFPPGFGVARVVLDPGHGATSNRGNTSSFCVDEQDAMLTLADAVRTRLEATGHVEVRLSRELGALVDYADRLDDAAAWHADAFVSLHSDVRGKIDRWFPEPGRACPIATDAPGFAVLYSDEGDPAMNARRLGLGRAVARHMSEAGFLAYGGAAYAGLYGADEGERGVFVDRHAPDQRIFVLRRAAMPSILVETHNALDPREASRWGGDEAVDAFAAAVAAALAETLGGARHGG